MLLNAIKSWALAGLVLWSVVLGTGLSVAYSLVSRVKQMADRLLAEYWRQVEQLYLNNNSNSNKRQAGTVLNNNFASSTSGKFIELSHGKVCYHLLGNHSGHLLVLIPSVLMFDFYGSGQSEAPAVLCDFSLYAETTIELIEKLGFSKPFTLCGSSFGALISLSIASDYPEKISRLVLISPGGFTPSILEKSLHTLPIYFLIQLLKTPIAPSVFTLIRHCVIASSVAFPYIRALIQFYIKDLPHLLKYPFITLDSICLNWSIYLVRLGRQLQDINLYPDYCLSLAKHFPFYGPVSKDVFECVRNHPKKILMIWGTGDFMHSHRICDLYKKRIPQVRICKLNGAGHLPLLDRTQDCFREIVDFLQQRKDSQAPS